MLASGFDPICNTIMTHTTMEQLSDRLHYRTTGPGPALSLQAYTAPSTFILFDFVYLVSLIVHSIHVDLL